MESLKFLERAKFEANVKLFEMMQAQQLSSDMMNNFASVENLKIDDEFFNMFEIE
jgi:hypothetical protein